MNKDDIQLLYEYDRWANNRALQAAATLSAEQFTRDLGGAFRSLRDTLVHIVAGEWAWLTYWNEPLPDDAFHADLDKRTATLFNPNAFPNVSAVQSKWAEVEKTQIDFVNRTTNESLEIIRSAHRESNSASSCNTSPTIPPTIAAKSP